MNSLIEVESEEEVRRLLGRHRATKYLKGFADEEGEPLGKTARIALDPEAELGWVVELRGAASSRA